MTITEVYSLQLPPGNDWACIAHHPQSGLRFVRNGCSGNTAFGGKATRILSRLGEDAVVIAEDQFGGYSGRQFRYIDASGQSVVRETVRGRIGSGPAIFRIAQIPPDGWLVGGASDS